MYDPTKHNYFAKLTKLARDLKTDALTLVHLVDIYHDDWCAIHRGRYCNCNPDVRLHPLLPPERN
jgi:hypothetical protein